MFARGFKTKAIEALILKKWKNGMTNELLSD